MAEFDLAQISGVESLPRDESRVVVEYVQLQTEFFGDVQNALIVFGEWWLRQLWINLSLVTVERWGR